MLTGLWSSAQLPVGFLFITEEANEVRFIKPQAEQNYQPPSQVTVISDENLSVHFGKLTYI